MDAVLGWIAFGASALWSVCWAVLNGGDVAWGGQ